jgi:hypothetical protein
MGAAMTFEQALPMQSNTKPARTANDACFTIYPHVKVAFAAASRTGAKAEEKRHSTNVRRIYSQSVAMPEMDRAVHQTKSSAGKVHDQHSV